MKAVQEHKGIMLEIEYSPDESLSMNPALGPIITSARVLGPDYRACGPNLVPLFDEMYMQTDAQNADKFLGIVATELA